MGMRNMQRITLVQVVVVVVVVALLQATLIPLVSAHMEIKYPPPRKSKFNPQVAEADRDYNMVAPLAADGSQLPCKRYPAAGVVASFNAGDTIAVEAAGTTFHGGGHCQFSLSYDDGGTFVVLKSVMRNCFTGTGLNFPVTIPTTAPAGEKVTFAWSWINAQGNREMYMNCADIAIVNTSPNNLQAISGKAYTIANQPGYPTIPEFPTATSYDGSDIYDQAKDICVGSGCGSSTGSTPSPPPPTATSSPPPPPTPFNNNPTVTPPTSSLSPPPPSPPPASSSTCTTGQTRCTGQTTWDQCSNGVWYHMDCGAGTKCTDSSGSVQCGW